MSILDQTACDLRDALRRGEVSAAEVTDACLDAVQRIEPTVHAFASIGADAARACAAEIDRRREAG